MLRNSSLKITAGRLHCEGLLRGERSELGSPCSPVLPRWPPCSAVPPAPSPKVGLHSPRELEVLVGVPGRARTPFRGEGGGSGGDNRLVARCDGTGGLPSPEGCQPLTRPFLPAGFPGSIHRVGTFDRL